VVTKRWRQQVESNRLLAALPLVEYGRIARHIEVVRLKIRQVLVFPDEPVLDIYFPRDAVLSMLVPMHTGMSLEGAVIGNEGLSGLALFLGNGTSPEEIIVQIPGEAARVTGQVFRDVLQQSPGLHSLIQGYTLALMSQLARTAGCNGVHPVGERFARWLLMSQDRVGRDKFPLTHEFLSMMLGVRRASVSEAASTLQHAGLIAYRHGQITILDRPGLEQASCEDYQVSRRTYDNLYQDVRSQKSEVRSQKPSDV
jgi:CRP-like cAMP-binding protein